ncbi:MAG: acylphosphatase [Acidimicrobiia bacterium]
MKAIRFKVTGLVQGVGYRQTCRRVARSLDLVGWVRNLPDGSVEAFAQGGDGALDSLLEWAWHGPVPSRVTGVESDVVASDPTLTDFFVQPNPVKMRGETGGSARDR